MLAEEICKSENVSEAESHKVESGVEDRSFAKESLGPSEEKRKMTRALGILWNTQRDTFEFDLSNNGKINNVIPTKRGILSSLATIFDPQGIISPISVAAKVLFPRLELMSARILYVLMNTVVAALSSQVRIDNSRYWLDSKTALFWIANNGVWKQFVQHRVNEILKLTNKVEWGHVDGVENPADIGSRSVTASQLRDSALWWEGPKWLRESEEAWPQSVNNENSEVVNEERRKTNVFSVCSENHLSVGQIIDINRFSTLSKLQRVTALVRRFYRNLRSKKRAETSE